MTNFSARLPCALPCGLGSLGFDPITTDTSLEAGLEAYLRAHPKVAALVGDRITPGYIPRGSTFPALDYKVPNVQRPDAVGRSAGFAIATVEFNCWSSRFADVVALATTLRLALQGFRRGWWGCCFVIGCLFEDQDDEYQEPKDGSGDYWFCRTSTYRIFFAEKTPKF